MFKLIRRFYHRLLTMIYHYRFANVHRTAVIDHRVTISNPSNLIMEENTNISPGAYIMNTFARVIFKKHSGAAFCFTAVTGNHLSIVGLNLKQVNNAVKKQMDINQEMDKDIIIEEDVWIGNHVILLSGVKVGRGSEVGAGSVVRTNVPPYSVVIGNPCKVVGFRFTPEEIIEHEKEQYPEEERLPIEMLNKNYEKYYLKRIQEVKLFTKV